jgi:hypothetical protein
MAKSKDDYAHWFTITTFYAAVLLAKSWGKTSSKQTHHIQSKQPSKTKSFVVVAGYLLIPTSQLWA